MLERITLRFRIGQPCLRASYVSQGRYTEAERAMERVVDIATCTYGREDEATALEMHSLANIKKGQGKYLEAEALFLAALK
eukprot:3738157-Pyramimonas_sp.AAC.1